mmetsp:Transcript_18104/g.42647  ORF Transcript_18104/g.42647 Transcript_18104/m.42647 type:complete len:346 (-) Transcript_18104:1685-2722(-)
MRASTNLPTCHQGRTPSRLRGELIARRLRVVVRVACPAIRIRPNIGTDMIRSNIRIRPNVWIRPDVRIRPNIGICPDPMIGVESVGIEFRSLGKWSDTGIDRGGRHAVSLLQVQVVEFLLVATVLRLFLCHAPVHLKANGSGAGDCQEDIHGGARDVEGITTQDERGVRQRDGDAARPHMPNAPHPPFRRARVRSNRSIQRLNQAQDHDSDAKATVHVASGERRELHKGDNECRKSDQQSHDLVGAVEHEPACVRRGRGWHRLGKPRHEDTSGHHDTPGDSHHDCVRNVHAGAEAFLLHVAPEVPSNNPGITNSVEATRLGAQSPHHVVGRAGRQGMVPAIVQLP